jgi:hypothetical protein
MIFIVTPCLLVFAYDQTGDDVDVPWLCLYYLCPFFVEMILTPAKEIIVITHALIAQGLLSLAAHGHLR